MFIINSNYFYSEVEDSDSTSNTIFDITGDQEIAQYMKNWCENAKPGDTAKIEHEDEYIVIDCVEITKN